MCLISVLNRILNFELTHKEETIEYFNDIPGLSLLENQMNIRAVFT